jgi:gas vesicle protein
MFNRVQMIEGAKSKVTVGESQMTTEMQDNSTNHGGSFLMGLIAGSAIGAGLALCFAPRLASELRQRVTDSTADLRNAASERLQAVATRVAEVADRLADVADDVTRRGQAVRDDVADAVGRGAHEVGRGAREVVRGARGVEKFAAASKTDASDARS